MLQASEKVFAITGATGVMLICYLIPVVLHLMLRAQSLKENDGTLTGIARHLSPAFSDSVLRSQLLDRLYKCR